MPWSLVEWYLFAPAFLLVLSRVAGLMLATPMFSTASIPVQFKAFLAVAMSLAVFPLAASHLSTPVTMGSALTGLIGELAVGVLLGMGMTAVFIGVQVAGQLIAQQSGLSLGSIFNPDMDASTTASTEVYFWVALIIFLTVGGDRALVAALLDSFQTLPPLSFRVNESIVSLLVDVMELSFVLAIRIGGPATLALMLAFLTLGFVSKTVPQLNLLSVGFPIKAAVGVLVMAVAIVSLEAVILDGLAECMDAIRSALALKPTG